MSLPNEIHPFMLGANRDYTIKKSLRFRASASAYLNRTNTATITNNKIFTYSLWLKRGYITASEALSLLSGDNSTAQHYFGFGNSTSPSDTLEFYDAQTAAWKILTTNVYRDPSAWYHVILSVDTTQATAANRVHIYVNGIECSYTTANYPAQNTVPNINVASMPIYISRRSNAAQWYFDGYMAELNFIDGQALTPSSFGQFRSTTGSWIPIAYAGSYGTNGFYLDFSTTTSATTLCYDKSGNGNNWTPNNISTTAGVTYDSMIDSPTNAASATQPVGNYATLNTLNRGSASAPTNGNLQYSTGNYLVPATFTAVGKWYWECSYSSGGCLFGVIDSALTIPAATYLLSAGSSPSVGYYNASGARYLNGVSAAYGSSFGTGVIIGIALDNTAAPPTIQFYNANVAQGSITLSSPTGNYIPAVSDSGAGAVIDVNFGQRPFTYTPPSGFVALCTANLPTPTITNGANYMAATTYTGTGATQTITNTVNSASFKPDFVWVKSRSAATNNNLFDAVRGTTNYLISNATNADATDANSLTAFASNGFTLGSDASAIGVNVSAATYVGWQWLGSNTTTSNTDGSITSTVCVNTTSGFSVVAYTGTGSAATVGHGLGASPEFIIQKPRAAPSQWPVYHKSIGNTNALLLNSTASQGSYPQMWNGTTPSASVFSLGNDPTTNYPSVNNIAYCFASVAGFSSFGSYTGNGLTTGPFVYCGFRPRFILIRSTSASRDWIIWDTTRNPYNIGTAGILTTNTSGAEYSGGGGYAVVVVSNGFYLPVSTANLNGSGETMIYAAFAECPFQYANAR